MKEIMSNEWVAMFGMALIVFALTQILKMPIKFFTKKIKEEIIRKRVNATILLIPFIIGVALELLYCHCITFQDFSVINGLGYGFAGISLYSIVERFFGVKNPYETEQGKEIVSMMQGVCKDGKVDGKDADAVKEFWDKVK